MPYEPAVLLVRYNLRVDCSNEFVMPGLDPGIHAFPFGCQDVDGRDKPGHDDAETSVSASTSLKCDSAAAAEILSLIGRRRKAA